MGLPKLWGKDKEGNRGFAFSHVKTIYYNWASKILLKTKLDEMDALIDAKIAKAMMSNQQVNDANKVPTSALAYLMSQNITKNANDISDINGNLGKTLLSTSILQKALELPNNGFFVYNLNGANYNGNDLPVGVYSYGSACIYKRNSESIFVFLTGIAASSTPLATNWYDGASWTGWKTYVTNTDLGIVYHPNIKIPSTKTAIENYIKTNLGTLRRFNTVRSDPAAGSESGIFPGGTSFCILWQCSSVAYGWVTLYSDLIGKPIVYGIINGTFTWYTPNLTQI